MNAIEKTKSLRREMVHADKLFINDLNPNAMGTAEFNMLYDNVEKMGITDPLLVRPVGDKYRIVGGAHRFTVGKLLDMEEFPCTIVTDPDFDDDQEKFQIVRMNVIRGRMSPDKFMKLYESLGKKYADEIMADSFGFADEEEFRKLVKQAAKELPKAMQAEFENAAKELKTIEGLSTLLNTMFTKYGDTLPYGYMFLDFGGKDSVWIRMSTATHKQVAELGNLCRENKRTMDDILGGMIGILVSDKPTLDGLIESSNEVEIPLEFKGMPSKDSLGV